MTEKLDDYYESLADYDKADEYILPDETYVMKKIEE